mgnify:CR=1 FL=1
MAKIEKTTVPFNGTEKQEALLREKLQEIKKIEGGEMIALQQAQDIYGYLPIEVQKIIAEELNVSLEKLYGVTTFYAQFALNPKGKYHVSVCMGTACYVKGAQAVLDKFSELLGIPVGGCTADRKWSLAACRCVGCCGLAPVATINDEVFGNMDEKKVAEIIAKFNAIDSNK